MLFWRVINWRLNPNIKPYNKRLQWAYTVLSGCWSSKVSILLGWWHQDHHIYSSADSCSADFPLQMALGFASVMGEEPCECNRTVCFCSKWKKQNANTVEILPPVLKLLVNFRKMVWLMFVGIFMPFPSVHLCISSLQTSFIIVKKKLVCPRKCCCWGQ